MNASPRESTVSNLSGKYAIAGIGETAYSRNSGMSTRQMAVDARAQRHGGRRPEAVGDRRHDELPRQRLHRSPQPSRSDLGIRLDFYMDCFGGGSSTEALVGIAMGAIEAGMCHTVAIYRSMNGYSELRIGGTGARAGAAACVAGADLDPVPYGMEQRRRRTSASPSCATCTSTARPTSRSRTSRWRTASTPRNNPQGLSTSSG